MNKKAVIVLGLALIFGAITAVAVNRVLKRQAEMVTGGEMVKVAVAVAPISVGQRITPDQVKLEERPKNTLPEGTLNDIVKVVDRVSLSEVTIGEALLSSRLAPEGSAAGLSAVIPPGMRAMTVKVDEVIGVAGFVAPGTYVDVVATAMRAGLEGESTSRIILQHVKVLASGKQIETGGKDGSPVEVKTVTLQVTPEQAEALALASTAGKLQLVMRNSVDQDQVETAGVDTAALFAGRVQGTSPSLPSRPAAALAPPQSKPLARKAQPKEVVPAIQPKTVELIQGDKRTTVTFQ